jgi:hypothetical protein
MEMVILPTKRRDLFTGLRRPARGNALGYFYIQTGHSAALQEFVSCETSDIAIRIACIWSPREWEDHACQSSRIRVRGNIF